MRVRAFRRFRDCRSPFPQALIPGHRAAPTRTTRYISGAGHRGLSYTRQRKGFTLAGYCDAEITWQRDAPDHARALRVAVRRLYRRLRRSHPPVSQAQQLKAISAFEFELTALVILQEPDRDFILFLKKLT